MCQLIAKPEGKILSKEVLQACWDKNPDGAGFCWSDGKHLHLAKGFMTFEAFYEEYRKYGDKMALIHFRVATHGKRCKDNTHPFLVAPDVAVGHNGVLRSFIPVKSDDRSDTRYFAETFVAPFFKSLMDWECLKDKNDYLGFVPVVAWMMEPIVDFSKLVWMTPGRFYFTGEQRGSWADKIWFSSGVATNRWYYEPVESTRTQSLANHYGMIQYQAPLKAEDERDFDGGYWFHNEDKNGHHHRQWIGDKVAILWCWEDAANISRDDWMKRPGHYNKHDAMVIAGLVSVNHKKAEVIDLQAMGDDDIDAPKDDDLVDAAIKNGTQKALGVGDMHIVYMMQKHDEMNAGEITPAEWQAALADMRPGEFQQFLRVFCEGDKDEQAMLESERSHGLALKAGKAGNQIVLPPWLSKELAKGDTCRPRVFLVAGRLLSRTGAQEVLMTASPLPKDPGFWKPIFRENGVVKGWESCADDSIIKEAIARGRKPISHEPTAIL